jgi:hypothetical protein
LHVARRIAHRLALAAILAAAAVALAAQSPRAQELTAYLQGETALDNQQWEDALKSFDAAPNTEGSLYWKAFALYKLGRNQEALTTLVRLGSAHPQSPWLKDASALQKEIASPASGISEMEITRFLSGLEASFQSDADSAATGSRSILESASPPQSKNRMLTALMNNASPKARELVTQAARGGFNPDLRDYAVSGLAKIDPQALVGIYRSADDARSRGYILSALTGARDKARVAEIAGTEPSPELRQQALLNLVGIGATDEAMQLLESESSPDVKRLVQTNLLNTRRAVLRNLTTLTTSSDPEARRGAAAGLEFGGGEDVDRTIVRFYGSEKDAGVKEAILSVLSSHRNCAGLTVLSRTENEAALKERIAQNLTARDCGPAPSK